MFRIERCQIQPSKNYFEEWFVTQTVSNKEGKGRELAVRNEFERITEMSKNQSVTQITAK